MTNKKRASQTLSEVAKAKLEAELAWDAYHDAMNDGESPQHIARLLKLAEQATENAKNLQKEIK